MYHMQLKSGTRLPIDNILEISHMYLVRFKLGGIPNGQVQLPLGCTLAFANRPGTVKGLKANILSILWLSKGGFGVLALSVPMRSLSQTLFSVSMVC